MTHELARNPSPGLPAQIADRLPPMVAADERTAWRYVDFFAVTIRNPSTREAYYRAVCRFMDWCERRGHGRRHKPSNEDRGTRNHSRPVCRGVEEG